MAFLLASATNAAAQTDRNLIRQGNRAFKTQKWAAAETQYRKAISKNQKNPQAIYNLGCALQKEHRDSDAINQYEQAVKTEPNKSVRSKAYYNMGVAHQTQKDYGKAMEAYKNCMRLNPADNDARYNYILCKRQQKQQQQNSGSNNKNNNDNKNKDKNKNQNNKDQQKNKQNQDNKNKNNDKQQGQNQPQNGEMSKDNAEQLLQAAMNEENQTEAKLKKAMQQPSRRQLDKNW